MNNHEYKRLRGFMYARKHSFRPSKTIISRFSAKKQRTIEKQFRNKKNQIVQDFYSHYVVPSN